MSLQSVAQSFDPGPRVELFELDATGLGADMVLRWTPGPLDGIPVSFGGVSYAPVPVEAEGFEWSGKGSLPTPRLRVSNVTRAATGLVLAFDDLRGASVIRKVTFKRFLDGQDEADGTALFKVEVWRVKRKAQHNRLMIEWELGTPHDQPGAEIPKRQVLRTCPWKYRRWDAAGGAFDYTQATCPYAGASLFNEQGASVLDPAQDRCSKQLISGCKARFGTSVALPFGGFPGVARVRG